MYSFDYSIELNEFQRPVIVPSKKTDKELDLTEHKFMALELVRSLLTSTLENHERNPEKRPIPPNEYDRMKNVLLEVEKMSDIFALTIRDQMELLNDTKVMLNPQQYDMQVGTVEELHGLNYNGIIYGEQIFGRKEGFRVMVMKEGKVYELKGGIDNEHWFSNN